MSNINNTIAGLELAQIGWVIPDIHAAVEFLANALGIAGFPPTGTHTGTESGYYLLWQGRGWRVADHSDL